MVFEIGFKGIALSSRHKDGIAVRFPRILRFVAVDEPCRDRLLYEDGRLAADRRDLDRLPPGQVRAGERLLEHAELLVVLVGLVALILDELFAVTLARGEPERPETSATGWVTSSRRSSSRRAPAIRRSSSSASEKIKKPIELRIAISSLVRSPLTMIGSVNSMRPPGRSRRCQSLSTAARPAR